MENKFNYWVSIFCMALGVFALISGFNQYGWMIIVALYPVIVSYIWFTKVEYKEMSYLFMYVLLIQPLFYQVLTMSQCYGLCLFSLVSTFFALKYFIKNFGFKANVFKYFITGGKNEIQ